MKRSYAIVLLVFIVFFVISFLTNILNPLIPEIKVGFNLGNAMAGFLPFSFFVAYGVMSIPAGMAVEKYHEKKVMIAAFFMAFLGAFLFALIPQYSIALISLFSRANSRKMGAYERYYDCRRGHDGFGHEHSRHR